jgi:hypothetical protein
MTPRHWTPPSTCRATGTRRTPSSSIGRSRAIGPASQTARSKWGSRWRRTGTSHRRARSCLQCTCSRRSRPGSMDARRARPGTGVKRTWQDRHRGRSGSVARPVAADSPRPSGHRWPPPVARPPPRPWRCRRIHPARASRCCARGRNNQEQRARACSPAGSSRRQNSARAHLPDPYARPEDLVGLS